MSAKISALPVSTIANNADLLTNVQGGVNKSVTRPILLTAVDGEQLDLTGTNLSSISQRTDGTIVITYKVGAAFIIQQSDTLTMLEVGPDGGILFISPTENNLVIGTGHLSINMTALGGIEITDNNPASVHITYVPADSSHWASTPPQDLAIAVDRIAAAVAGLLGTPIP